MAIKTLVSLLALSAFADRDGTTVEVEDGRATVRLDANCKKESHKVELWYGTSTAGYYSRIETSSDGFETRLKYRQNGGKVRETESDGEFKCSARYRFFKVTETCSNGTKIGRESFGKIENWVDFSGPNDCATDPTSWRACGTINGMPTSQVCVKVHYCSTPNCVISTEVNATTSVSGNQLKYDVSLLGLTSQCGGNSQFGIEMRAATKSELNTRSTGEVESSTDASGASCPIIFAWATQAKVNGVAANINFGTCPACTASQSQEESDSTESDERNHCCSYSLGNSGANELTDIVWDPVLSVGAVSSATHLVASSFVALFLLAANALLF